MLEEVAYAERCGRNFDHGAKLERAVGHASVGRAGRGRGPGGPGSGEFAGVRQHGHKQVHLVAQRRAGWRATGRNMAGSARLQRMAQAQRRVEVSVVVQGVVQWFVGAHVHGAYGDRQALHALHGTTVSAVLFFFTGEPTLAPHEQEFAAK